MTKPRTSKAWKIPEDQFRRFVSESFTCSDVVRKIGYSSITPNLKTVKKRISELGLDTSHFTLAYRKPPVAAKPFEEILVENSTYSRCQMKKRLIAAGKLSLNCQICGCRPEWNGLPLALQIDHINGVHNDNRIENLRLLCPNCHSQTDSFAGRKNRKSDSHKNRRRVRREETARAKQAGEPTWRNRPRLSARKVDWPTKDKLQDLIWKFPTTKVSKMFGVSDKAVEKWCKRYSISKPPRGYWRQNIPASSNG